jgi:hypothetical protein
MLRGNLLLGLQNSLFKTLQLTHGRVAFTGPSLQNTAVLVGRCRGAKSRSLRSLHVEQVTIQVHNINKIA